MSLYSLNGAPKGARPWSGTLAFGRNIKSFYKSRGNATLTGMNEIATLPDGPEKVVMYDNLTVGDGTTVTTLTASQRCKGLTIIVRGNVVVKNNATIKMTARGARVDRGDDPRFPFIDFKIPGKIGLYSEVMSREAALELIATHGLAPWDRGFWDSDGGLPGLNCSIAEAGATTLMLAGGCGAGGAAAIAYTSSDAGKGGSAGSNGGMGGGGSGGAWSTSGYYGTAWRGGGGCPYGGGAGSGGVGNNTGVHASGAPGSRYSGHGGYGGIAPSWNASFFPFPGETATTLSAFGGGGAGNPGGLPGGSVNAGMTAGENGTGGKLVIVCYGNITVESGGRIESNGSVGGHGGTSPTYGGGGGSGGGHISLIHAGACTNNGTVQCAGGAGGAGSGAGGAGGAGSVVTKTFAQMGWS